MTQNQLKKILKLHLRNFNDEGVEINDNTIHNQVLSPSDGVGPLGSSKTIYEAIIRWTMRKNGHQDKEWPNDWFDKSVEYLSSKII